MKCVFVGSLKEDSGYIVEVLQEKEYEIIQAGEYDQIEKTINPVLESQAEIAVYDLLPLNDDPLEIVEVIDSIQQSRRWEKIIFLAAGMGKNTPVIDALRKAGYVNFVLDSTYGAKKEKFARCLTNFYESNADRLDRELSDTECRESFILRHLLVRRRGLEQRHRQFSMQDILQIVGNEYVTWKKREIFFLRSYLKHISMRQRAETALPMQGFRCTPGKRCKKC